MFSFLRLCFFSMAKSVLRMGSCVRFCCHNILFRTLGGEGYQFHCCREISLVSQTFDERIRCIRRHDDFSPRSHCKLLLKTRPFWPYSYILWKAVYRNIRHLCINLVANIIWGPGNPICSSFLLDFSFLHHDCRRVFTVFYVIAMLHFLAAKSYFQCTKKYQGELTKR